MLAGRGEDFPFTHDIAALIELCEDQGFQLPDDLREADRLTPYAAALRYGLGDPEAVVSEDALMVGRPCDRVGRVAASRQQRLIDIHSGFVVLGIAG